MMEVLKIIVWPLAILVIVVFLAWYFGAEIRRRGVKTPWASLPPDVGAQQRAQVQNGDLEGAASSEFEQLVDEYEKKLRARQGLRQGSTRAPLTS